MSFKNFYRFLVGVLFVLAFAMCFSGCKKADVSSRTVGDGRISVVTTIFPLFDFTRQVVGNSVDLKMLMQPGVDAHSFEPSSETIKSIENCDVLIYLGNDVDFWVDKILNSIDDKKKNKIKIVNMSQKLKSKSNNLSDPHLWISLQNTIEMLQILKENFEKADPPNSAVYGKNADLFVSKLAGVKKRFEEVVAGAKRRVLVFGGQFPFKNFVEEFNLSVMTPYVNCSAKSEALSSKLSELVDFVNRNKIPVVLKGDFGESGLAEAIAGETKAKVKIFHDCHTISAKNFSEGKTYLDFMEQNLETLKEALN